MTRLATLALASLLLAAAGPKSHAVKQPAPPRTEPELPLPPPLPSNVPLDEPAPVPNAALRAPGVVISEQTEFGFHVFRMREFGANDSVVPGSTYQSPEQRKPMQPPGFLVTVPLH